ncbi:MAG: hypothetical protein VW270_03445 [Candidatus Poseidoniales archaeon]
MQDDDRGLDHLIEQNSTELGFLDVYGSEDEMSNDAILEAVRLFLEKENVDFENKDNGIKHDFGTFQCSDEGGVSFEFLGTSFPLVPSDFSYSDIANGLVNTKKKCVQGELFDWSDRLERFFSRLIEHHRLE